MRRLALLLPLAACAQIGLAPPVNSPGQDTIRPMPRPGAEAPISATGRTADALDTTSAEERAQAAAPTAGGARLGTTVASLGNPAEQGFWLETPLVSAPTQGRVVLPATGMSVKVELRPIPGDPGAGSRLSLAAMRLLGVALTDLPTIEVWGA